MTKKAFVYPRLNMNELSSKTPESDIVNNIENNIKSQNNLLNITEGKLGGDLNGGSLNNLEYILDPKRETMVKLNSTEGIKILKEYIKKYIN